MTPIKFALSEIILNDQKTLFLRYVAIGFIVIFSNPRLVLNSGK
jgi:hypothetical protein